MFINKIKIKTITAESHPNLMTSLCRCDACTTFFIPKMPRSWTTFNTFTNKVSDHN